jgi:hypothetical protein
MKQGEALDMIFLEQTVARRESQSGGRQNLKLKVMLAYQQNAKAT